MKVMIIYIVIDAFRTVAKWLIRGLEDLEIRGRVETITEISQNTKKSWRLWELLSLKLHWKNISKGWCEKLSNYHNVLENELHKIPYDLEVQTDHLSRVETQALY